MKKRKTAITAQKNGFFTGACKIEITKSGITMLKQRAKNFEKSFCSV